MNTSYKSKSRQDYLKAILSLELKGNKITTTSISEKLCTKPASVTGMFKVLSDLELIKYQPYKGAKLTQLGRNEAISLIRKHRLWETFMVDYLGFGWDEVHEVAEQLEHVESKDLIDKLDAYMGNPPFDPHGDPIPDKDGNLTDSRRLIQVHTLQKGEVGCIQGVLGSNDTFLKHLGEFGIKMGLVFTVKKVFEYDGNFLVEFVGDDGVQREYSWSRKLVEQLLAEIN
ncbi:MAG: iron-dependent repressor [Crocinitomicaceae bacterium]|nr:iron-dependent repressor [Crocinitomicaceae bacterium]|tara:strand:- start:3865 stop:4548 length:684 start_codon:yes stop_codon:yes gene_type:complete